MGYPMTYQRVINRNGLVDGSYEEIPQRHRGPAVKAQYDRSRGWGEFSPAERFGTFLVLLSGDLRRLEQDAVDEGAICRYIGSKIGVDVEVVAAVLKEFMAW